MKDALTVLLSVLTVWACLLGAAAGHAQRIAWTCDGNYHDKDDWGSAPMALKLIAEAGQSNRLVHFDFNSHIPQSSRTWEDQMRTSVWGATSRYGPFACSFCDCKPSMGGAIASLRAQIQQSTSLNRLTVCLAGPPETLYQALQGVPNATRRHVTVCSHSSPYNETSGPHTLAQCSGIVMDRIPNQNQRLNTKQNWGPWAWLKTSDPWLYQRMRASGRADVSDSGMMYYLLYGKSTPTVADYRGRLE